ncbi:hypothetical protein GGI23_002553, partial [Coemansia sp. RSA 2559]
DQHQGESTNILSTFNSNGGSNPASPIDTLSTMPTDNRTNNAQQTFMNHLMAVQGYVPGAMSQPIGGMDHRAKAPHWVDPGLWEMWIAAANGHDSSDITAMAAATAMGITPGVSGVPQTFLPSQPLTTASAAAPSSSFAASQYTTQQQHPVDNELLHMFASVNRKPSKINSSPT